MGGSVALELEKSIPNKYETTTYGAPVVSFTSGNRYRHGNDPFTSLDFGATIVVFYKDRIEAHSYNNY